MKRAILALSVTLPLAASAQHAAEPAPPRGGATARAALKDGTGKGVGTATFSQAGGALALHLDVRGLPPGEHGVHVHAAGKCDGPDFKTAGGHFNPTNKKHGHDNPEGAHAGDLPNLLVGPDGTGHLDATLAGVTLGDGPTSLFGKDGTSLVVHGGRDDGKTDPAGNSGARIACGVVTRGS